MMALTRGAQIDELRRALGASAQRRQAAEPNLADRERGTSALRANRSLPRITGSAG